MSGMDIGFPTANKKSHSTSSQNCHVQFLLAYLKNTGPLLIGPLALCPRTEEMRFRKYFYFRLSGNFYKMYSLGTFPSVTFTESPTCRTEDLYIFREHTFKISFISNQNAFSFHIL